MFSFGMFSLIRRSLKPCSPRLEKEHASWKRLDSFFKGSVLFQRFLSFSKNGLYDCCPFQRASSLHMLWDSVARSWNEKLVLFGEILTKQCNFYAAQRLVRMTQVGSLYHRLYAESTMRHMVAQLVRRIQSEQGKSLSMLLGATLFCWETEKITENDLKRCINEFDELSMCKHRNSRGNAGSMSCHAGQKVCEVEENREQGWSVSQLQSQGWECVIQREHLHVWRKAVPCSYLYEYKVFGTFYDIPARAFFSVQMDTDYRKKWDKLVISLDIIDRDDQGSEVIHWVMHYPYPMYSRDYVYIRRAMVDSSEGVMVLMSRATDHPQCPADKKYVRVKKYFSQMVIRPHKNFDDIGFDYLLSYFDDPEAAFPAPAYNWMASSGVPDFVEKLHSAARGLYFQHNPTTSPCTPALHHHNGPSLQQVYA